MNKCSDKVDFVFFTYIFVVKNVTNSICQREFYLLVLVFISYVSKNMLEIGILRGILSGIVTLNSNEIWKLIVIKIYSVHK